VPIEKTLRPLLVAFANAANNMPSLRKAFLWTSLEFDPQGLYDYYEDLSTEISESEFGWGIAYAKPGKDAEMKMRTCSCTGSRLSQCRHRDNPLIGHRNRASRQFWWMTQDWRPDATLHTLFDKIGQFQHGNEAIHHWGSAQGQKWFRQSLFDGFIRRALNPLPERQPDHIPF